MFPEIIMTLAVTLFIVISAWMSLNMYGSGPLSPPDKKSISATEEKELLETSPSVWVAEGEAKAVWQWVQENPVLTYDNAGRIVPTSPPELPSWLEISKGEYYEPLRASKIESGSFQVVESEALKFLQIVEEETDTIRINGQLVCNCYTCRT